MVKVICTGLVCMTAIVLFGLHKGHDGALIGLALSTISGVIGAVVAHYKTKAKYRKENPQ